MTGYTTIAKELYELEDDLDKLDQDIKAFTTRLTKSENGIDDPGAKALALALFNRHEEIKQRNKELQKLIGDTAEVVS